ncbi:MAG: M24 family metallopeptidase [Candidatus Lokiarchaeota archaeon]|nr:M24 family metallopeptidase [Candidatus Lokiarchaeota archaeon]
MIKMRINRVKKELEKKELDSFVVYNPINVLYLTNFLTQSFARLLLTKDESSILLVPELEFEEARSIVNNFQVEKITAEKSALKWITEILEEFNSRNCGIEEQYITKKDFDDLRKKNSNLEFIDAGKILDDLRAVKSEGELKKLRKSAEIADRGMQKAIESIEPGKKEIDIAAIAEYEMRKNGSEPIAFDTIVASGPRSAFPHAKSTENKIEDGDFVIIDLGARYAGYTSDTSRTIIVGKPSEKQRAIYHCVLDAQLKAESKCSSQIKASELDSIAREAIKGAQYGKYFNHSLGHGVGLEVHENPTISPKNNDQLKVNNVITIEPGIYIPQLGGVRIEDTVIVKRDKCEILNKTHKLEI